MAASEHATRLEELPSELPVFPLTGVLLLPRGRLPLNIFEPRYLAMTRDALAPPRLIGMIQPLSPDGDGDVQAKPDLYGIGCAGRIVSFSETDDGRFLMTLVGVARFEVGAELPMRAGYRRVAPKWDRFKGDLAADPGPVDRKALLASLKPYFESRGLKADWQLVEKTEDERLIAMLAMVCPFAPPEKQALLEAPGVKARAELLQGLIEMALATPVEPTEMRRH